MKHLVLLVTTVLLIGISHNGISQNQPQDILSRETLVSQNVINASSDFISGLFIPDGTQTYTHDVLNDSILQSMVGSFEGPVRPFLWGKSILFTYYDPGLESRVSISLKNEKFNATYPFYRLKANPSILVYAHPREFETRTIDYRLIINGAWTYDTQNPNYITDINQVKISRIELKQLPSSYLSPIVVRDEVVRFYFYYEPEKILLQDLNKTYVQDYPPNDQLVLYLVGNFTSWDPYMIPLKQSEIDSHLYYTDLSLNPGTHHYYYNMGEKSVLDPKNVLVSKRHKSNGFVNTFSLGYDNGRSQELMVSLEP